MNILLLIGAAIAGFVVGWIVRALYMRRRTAIQTIMKRVSSRKHSLRTWRGFKLSRRRYRLNLKQFRFNPRDNYDW